MAWTTTFEVTFDNSDNAWENTSIRNSLTPALVEALASIPGGSTHVRVTFESSNLEALKIDEAYIGHATTTYNAADLTQITFNGGSASAVIPIGRKRVTSDPVEFTYDQIANLLVTMYCPNDSANTGGGRLSGVTGFQTYFLQPGSGQASLLTPSAHSAATAGRANIVMRLEFGISEVTRFAFSIVAGKVASDQTGFVALIDLANMPPEFWAAVDESGGGIRVEQDSVELPIDLVNFNKDAETGRLFFKADLLSASDNEFQVVVDDTKALIPVDGVNGRHDVWSDYEAVYIFTSDFDRLSDDRTGNDHELSPVGSLSTATSTGILVLNGTNYYYTQSVPKFTDWSMGVSCIPSSVSGIETVLAYTDGSSVSNRESLVRNTNAAYELWNNSDLDIDLPGGVPTISTRARLNATHTNTTTRSGYLNGVAVTDAPCAQRPGGTAPVDFIIGAEIVGGTEEFTGSIDYVYLRDGALSSHWIAAEHESWEDPATFLGDFTLVEAPTEFAKVYKTTAYSVLERIPRASVFKSTAYSVLAAPPPEPPLEDSARVFKTTAYSVLAPVEAPEGGAFKYSYLPVVN